MLLVGSQRRAVELGAPPTWPNVELGRVRRQALRMSLRGMRRRIAVPAVALVAGLALVIVAGINGFAVLLALAIVAAIWVWQMTAGGRAAIEKWRVWARGRHALERELRLLDSSWRLLWDRRVDALPGPVTIAIGPSGAWVLWWAEPVIAIRVDDKRTHAAAEQVADFSRLPTQLHAWLRSEPAADVRALVHGIACAPVRASADQVNQAAEMLDAALLQEPVELRAHR